MTETERDLKKKSRPGDQAETGTPGMGENTCPVCEGQGVMNGQECENCCGAGVVIEGIGGG
jgi:DnaJ-class molecular chaperone